MPECGIRAVGRTGALPAKCRMALMGVLSLSANRQIGVPAGIGVQARMRWNEANHVIAGFPSVHVIPNRPAAQGQFPPVQHRPRIRCRKAVYSPLS